MVSHVFTSELIKFTTFEEFVEQKLGKEKAQELLTGAGTGEKISTEFSSFYDYWLNEFKISHAITEEGKDPKISSYKDLSAERIIFITNVVNTLSTGGELK